MIIRHITAGSNPYRPASRAARLVGAVVAGLVFTAGCGENADPVNPDERLCNGEAGLGVLVEGRSQPLEFCLDDADVPVTLTSGTRYDIAGQMSLDGDVFQVRMVFALRNDFPVSLRLVDTLTEAVSDIDAVWIEYAEFPDNGAALESFAVTGGTFRLSFSDVDVLAGTFEGVSLGMHVIANGDPAGARVLSEGFFSLSVKEPAAVAAGELP